MPGNELFFSNSQYGLNFTQKAEISLKLSAYGHKEEKGC